MARVKTLEKPSTTVAYYRTSSAANVGVDKDSLARQRDAVMAYARGHGSPIDRVGTRHGGIVELADNLQAVASLTCWPTSTAMARVRS